MNLLLERFNYAPDGTFGRLHLPSGNDYFTCEQPWNGNAIGQSCIPEGVYTLKIRPSPVVLRSSGGEFEQGYEVIDVPGRTFIMIHPANWPHELRGCIAPGIDYKVMDGKQAITSSRDAFRRIMNELAMAAGEINLTIRQYQTEFV